MKDRVCHITTLHPAKDARIFHKECVSLAKHFDVHLIVANQQSEIVDGVTIHNIDVPQKRIPRFFKASKIALKKALDIDAKIYHFHDPELLSLGLQLKKKGKIVIYDSHEDVPRQILEKPYIPKVLRHPIANIYERYENNIARQLDAIITPTPHIENRFLAINPRSLAITNFPILQRQKDIEWTERKNQIAYIGSLTKVRGVKELVQSLEQTDTTLMLGGKWWFDDFKNEVAALPAWNKVQELGFLNRQEVWDVLSTCKIGMVTLHPIENYKVAYAVKMFEYMAAGVPIIASDFPLWRSIIEEAQCGICVDPLDTTAVATAISDLLNDDEKAKQMGENGKRAAHKIYNWSSQEKKLIELYNSFF